MLAGCAKKVLCNRFCESYWYGLRTLFRRGICRGGDPSSVGAGAGAPNGEGFFGWRHGSESYRIGTDAYPKHMGLFLKIHWAIFLDEPPNFGWRHSVIHARPSQCLHPKSPSPFGAPALTPTELGSPP
ncbi:hypothetical protein VTP01DRAFT_8073 [Rhizomucor pusillus]|uniref:uncharacterized protein n=1 Tax=Rhizomucor pusillus TaxID=4840 RepID=UPI003743D45E